MLAVGCSDSGGGTVVADAGPRPDGSGSDSGTQTVRCPNSSPAPDNQEGVCCYRASNAERLDAPEFRVSAFSVASPTSLSGGVVGPLIQGAIDEERFNWIIALDVAEDGTSVSARTGYGERAEDGTLSFVDGTAPVVGKNTDVNRWNPITIEATLDGETITTPAPYDGIFNVPIIDADGTTVVVELPVRGFKLENLVMSEERSCVGRRSPGRYTTTEAQLTAFITMEDADQGVVNVPPVNETLCLLLSGAIIADGSSCADHGGSGERTYNGAPWASLPNAFCDAEGACEADTGDGSVCLGSGTAGEVPLCNAWKLTANFGAQGAEITN